MVKVKVKVKNHLPVAVQIGSKTLMLKIREPKHKRRKTKKKIRKNLKRNQKRNQK